MADSPLSFPWRPRVGPAADVKFSVLAAQFGDGYRQTAPNGLNAKTESWPLEFVGYSSELGVLRSFLDVHAGSRTFFWTPPLAPTPRLFECAGYTLTALGGDRFQINATFTQAFRPGIPTPPTSAEDDFETIALYTEYAALMDLNVWPGLLDQAIAALPAA